LFREGKVTEPQTTASHRIFIERLVIAIAIVAVALLVWRLSDLLLLVFGAVLVAVILRAVAMPFRERLGLPHGLSLLIAVLLLFALIGGLAALFGAQAMGQAVALQEAIPAAWQELLRRLEPIGLAQPLQGLAAGGESIVSRIGNVAMSVGSGLADTLLVLAGGIYLAAEPGLYRTGLLKLVPERARPLVDEAMKDSGRALMLWLKGRLVSMTIVGILTWIGLVLLGVPAAVALAVVAFLLEFIPFLGPILSAIPAILLAMAISPTLALWTGGLYLLIQQLEGNIVEPLVQKRAVSMPPVLLLFAVVAGALLFGMTGVILAAPLTVVLFVLVKRLYVREALDTPTPIPGEND
jgi:predicted PurR-regulated permease PerM